MRIADCGVPLTLTLSPMRLCRNEGNAMLVILNPSPVILNPSPPVTLSETKGLIFRLRINSVKNLCHWLRVNSARNLIESIS